MASAPSQPNPVNPGATSTVGAERSSQILVACILLIFVGVLIVRGYGSGWMTRPTETVTLNRIDLNRADRTQLEQIPSIGPKLASAIEEHRQQHGPFHSVDELRNVKGVGPAKLDKFRPYLRVENDTEAATATITPDRDPPLAIRKTTTVSESLSKSSAPSPKTATPAAPVARSTGRKRQMGDPPLNINEASLEELQELPGVGKVTAGNIITARNERPFRSIADVDRVKGIGPKMLEKIRPFIVLE